MIIYRLEKNLLGPFLNRAGHHLIKPAFFKKGDNPDHFLYGCESLEDLITYFGPDFEKHLENGYVIKQHKVKKKCVRFNKTGPSEVAFHMSAIGLSFDDIISKTFLTRQFSDSMDI